MLYLSIIKKQEDFPQLAPRLKFLEFLYKNLDEYRDKKSDIDKAIDYAFSDAKGKGGFVLTAIQDGKLIGGAVVNKTGMSGYIPHYILVYISTHKEYRGQGIGRKIIEKVKQECPGDIALHVEYDNPAVNLYKKAGFKSKYAEMRYKNKVNNHG
jgi:GNAT superfamily N-acetyltransferase